MGYDSQRLQVVENDILIIIIVDLFFYLSWVPVMFACTGTVVLYWDLINPLLTDSDFNMTAVNTC